MSDGNSFLGTGWSFPPSFAASGGDVHVVSGVEDIEQSLAILLSTQRGERVMRDGFGCDLKPTAGYWKDGLRFIEDIKTNLPNVSFDSEQLIRSR